MQNYCFKCMEPIDGGFCPFCYRDNAPDNIGYHLKPGTILHQKYIVGNCIGEGGFGITYIGRELTLDIRVAIKELYPNGFVFRNNDETQMVFPSRTENRGFVEKSKERFLEEARNIAKFTGEPGIVGVREFFEENGTAYIIMEYLEGMDLSSFLRQYGVIPAEKVFEIMLPVTLSLKKIHDAGIIHRDISPSNIMYLKSGTLKLMDFGNARFYNNSEKEMSVILKRSYAPEEQYRKNNEQGPWTDVYSLCATMYKCITGKMPVEALDRLRDDTLLPPSKTGISIPPAYESVLMYGMQVLKENRCRDMEELSGLMKKCLYGQEKTVIRPHEGETEQAFAHPLINGSLGKQTEPVKEALQDSNTYGDDFYGSETGVYSSSSDEYHTRTPAKKSKSPAVIFITITVALIISAGLIALLLLKSGSGPVSDSDTSSGASNSSSSMNNNFSYQSSESSSHFSSPSSETEEDVLNKKRQTAKNILTDLYQPDNYEAEQRNQAEELIREYEQKIDSADSVYEMDSLSEEYSSLLARILTKSQLDLSREEESRRAEESRLLEE